MVDTFLTEAPNHAYNGTKLPYNNVFTGYCNTIALAGTGEPVRLANLCNLDTGARRSGKLTLMDIDTFEYRQSGLLEIEGKFIPSGISEHFSSRNYLAWIDVSSPACSSSSVFEADLSFVHSCHSSESSKYPNSLSSAANISISIISTP